jgi:hypothetical protein
MSKFRISFFGFIILIVMAFPAWGANVGLFGFNSNSDIASFLSGNGHTVTDFGGTAPTAIQLAGLDVLILLRTSGTNDIANFVTSGGLLITEWDASVWTLNTANLIDADDTGGSGIGSTPITFTSAGASLAQGVNNPYSDGGSTEFFRSFANIGVTVDILATRPGNIPAILGGSSGNGQVLVIGYDWADGFSSANADTRQLILNAVNFERQLSVPTMNEWGMIIFMALAGIGAVYYLRKDKKV